MYNGRVQNIMKAKVYALIIAGGVGARMGTDIPKQFLSVFDRPVLSYTMEAFQKDENIDGIAIVCVEGWDHMIDAIAKQYKITKYIGNCLGGSTGQESIYRGLCFLKSHINENDIVLIHDAIRPLVSQAIIDDCIKVVKERGNAVSVIPCNEVILENVEGSTAEADRTIPRSILKRTQTPQGASLKTLLEMHEKAKAEGKSYIATADMLLGSGYTVHYSIGSEKNVKLTTQDDLDIMKALLQVSKNER